MGIFSQTLAVTAPVFSMLFLGILLKRIGAIDDRFIDTASRLVFNATLPTLLFLGIAEVDLSAGLHLGVLLYFALASAVGFALAWLWSLWRCPAADRGVFVQGAFRGNNGIIGLALANSMYGGYGLALGSILSGVVILCYNSLSVLVLTLYSPQARISFVGLCRNILINPLVLGVLLALPLPFLGIHLPDWLLTSAHYFARLSLPLALICIGGSLSLAALRNSSGLALDASLVKMLWLPALSTLGAWALGFRGADLGVLFLYFAAPTASASYVMARAYGGDYQLAAVIIVITTLAAVLTTNVGILFLQWGGWI